MFPQLPLVKALGKPQPYWGNLCAFVEGWAGSECADRGNPWPFLGANLMELPYNPMHAPNHRKSNSKQVRKTLRDLFVERAEAITAQWPRAVFVVLGASVHDALIGEKLLGSMTPVALDSSSLEESVLGTKYFEPVSAGALAIEGSPKVFIRRGPFSNSWSPTEAGRRELGRILRAHKK